MDATAGKRSGLSDLAHLLCQLAAAGYPVDIEPVGITAPTATQTPDADPIGGRQLPQSRHITPPSITCVDKGGPDNHKKPNHNDMLGGIGSTRFVRQTDRSVHANGNPDLMKNSNSNLDIDVVKQALLTVQQGLESMQALQRQTTEAHQKFLDTQKEAGRTLQHMLEHNRRLTEIALGERTVAAELTATTERPTVAETNGSARHSEPARIVRVAPLDSAPTSAAAPAQTTMPQDQRQDKYIPSVPRTASDATADIGEELQSEYR